MLFFIFSNVAIHLENCFILQEMLRVRAREREREREIELCIGWSSCSGNDVSSLTCSLVGLNLIS